MNMPVWFSNLWFWSLQVALLAGAAAALPRLVQLRQPRVLLAYWRSVIVLTLLLPLLQPWQRPQGTTTLVVSNDFVPATPLPPASLPASPWHLPDGQTFAYLAVFILLAGVLVRFAMLALGVFRLRQLRRDASPISQWPDAAALLEAVRSRIAVPAEFRLSSRVDSPVTFGFSAPVILLPEKFPPLDPRFQSAIACHELLHVRRRDWAHHLGEEILRALFWFHPAIAWLVSRVRLAREQVVDLEVVRLTEARKPYVEALLEFANRRSVAVILAPPFLVERQLVERVSLMLKEVRMSRSRLIASLVVVSCCLGLVVLLVAWTFPLKAAPLPAQSAPRSGVTGGVTGGVGGGVSSGPSGGIKGGVAGGLTAGVARGTGGEAANSQQSNEPEVDHSTIWVDTVKRGPMVRQVRGLGTLVRSDSGNFVARVSLPESMVKEVQSNQNATVACAVVLNSVNTQGLVKGHVSSVSSEVVSGTVSVDVSLDGPLPQGVATNLPLYATIDIEKIDDVLLVGRPVHATANSMASVFKITSDGKEAERVEVRFGRSSVNTIEVLDGLKAGDKIILSDMSNVENAPRIRLTEEEHLTSH